MSLKLGNGSRIISVSCIEIAIWILKTASSLILETKNESLTFPVINHKQVKIIQVYSQGSFLAWIEFTLRMILAFSDFQPEIYSLF